MFGGSTSCRVHKSMGSTGCSRTGMSKDSEPRGAALLAVEQTHSEAEQHCKIKLKIVKLGGNTVPNCRKFSRQKVIF